MDKETFQAYKKVVESLLETLGLPQIPNDDATFTFIPLVNAIIIWAEKHIDDIQALKDAGDK